ncbi:hypothetical protein [Deinococcus maricopensis]|uniref:hypothetical protein n=1 Tax=Deinococcus maricopensis TaxID=309887 RepID=UPI00031120F3|nr:hypothetical protein [Deinococcus maricopensis]
MDIHLTPAEFETFLNSLYERDDRLGLRADTTHVLPSETVDAYVLSGHVEALRTEDIDGDLWDALEDLDETAADEDEAWRKIRAFYLDRGCVALHVGDDEYLLTEALARRLNLL